MFLLDSRIFFFKILESLFFLEISLSPRVSILSFLCLCLSKRELCLKKKRTYGIFKKKKCLPLFKKKKKKKRDKFGIEFIGSCLFRGDCVSPCVLKRLWVVMRP